MNQAETPRRLGFIGLGIMGGPMAGNLLDAGHEVAVWNRTTTKTQPLADRGATLAASPADLAAQKPAVVFLNVTNTQYVEAILFGEHGIASAAQPGRIRTYDALPRLIYLR